ncbi:mannose-1-phosphate guanylyltransferase [Thioclava sp. GXIMD4215]|uniref:mannose-1-phosphate guanylyltransferase n=1 Tax=Thioclava sp. GXIMD4215 TaxID=3131928 RepID=UPI00324399A7
MYNAIRPTVLCGGMGSRLWPMSRVEQPKQFQSVNGRGGATFFQETVQRHTGKEFGDPIVVTNARQTAIVKRQLRDIQKTGQIIGEPMGRNTGPAVLAAALYALRDDRDAKLLVLPSDHIISGDINTIITAMLPAAEAGQIITFGVIPTYAETGYGYITDGGAYDHFSGLHRVLRFVEKPPAEVALKMLEDGQSYWASGISMLRADLLVEEFAKFDPQTLAAVSDALAHASEDQLGASVLEENAFGKAANEPTERLIFERSEHISLAPLPGIDWNDVGAWNSVHSISDQKENGNVTFGDVVTHDTANSLIRSEDRLVAVIGLDDVIVVDTPDALLLANRERSQDVKLVVEQLKKNKRNEVISHRLRDVTWGQSETLRSQGDCEMEMMRVESGAKLTVNGTGEGRSILTMISGQGECTLPEGERTLFEGCSIMIDADYAMPVSNISGRAIIMLHVKLTELEKVRQAALAETRTEDAIRKLVALEEEVAQVTLAANVADIR